MLITATTTAEQVPVEVTDAVQARTRHWPAYLLLGAVLATATLLAAASWL